jgi:serine protease Do
MSLLEELTTITGRVAETSGAAVVRIGRDGGRGAGTVIGAGLVFTSAHNVRGNEVTITFPDGRVETGEVKGIDPDGDIAVIAVDTGSVPPVAWVPGETGDLGIGSVVFALGLLPAGGNVRVTNGTVSAVSAAFRGPRGRLIANGVEHTAPVGRGSSGGPIVDEAGRLVGINTHRPGDGLYLALPADAALKGRVDALGRGEAPSRPRLGVALTPPHVARRMRAAVGLTPREGVLIREVGDDTPAAAAGLRRGDLIVSAGGVETASIDAFLEAIEGVVPGGVLAVTVWRGNDETTVEVRFEAA